METLMMIVEQQQQLILRPLFQDNLDKPVPEG